MKCLFGDNLLKHKMNRFSRLKYYFIDVTTQIAAQTITPVRQIETYAL